MSITQNTDKNRRGQFARQRVLAQWRGVDLEPLEKARLSGGKAVGTVLSAVLCQLKLDKKQGDAEILKVWNQVLDPVVTAHAQPVNLHKGTLFIQVDSSPWLDEIVRYRRKEILARLQHSFGRESILKLSFRLG